MAAPEVIEVFAVPRRQPRQGEPAIHAASAPLTNDEAELLCALDGWIYKTARDAGIDELIVGRDEFAILFGAMSQVFIDQMPKKSHDARVTEGGAISIAPDERPVNLDVRLG
jgi:hypothetical protein